MGKMKELLIEIVELYRDGMSLQNISNFTGVPIDRVVYILEQYYGGAIENEVIANA